MPVIDASVVIDWVSPEASAMSPSIKLLNRLSLHGADLVGPRLLLEEVSNALLSGIRRRRWSGAAADSSHGLLLRLPIRLTDDQRDLMRGWELARRYDNHPVYDMIYVALAERSRTELVTADASLRRRLTHLSWIIGLEDAASA